jgi:hypothetical protein
MRTARHLSLLCLATTLACSAPEPVSPVPGAGPPPPVEPPPGLSGPPPNPEGHALVEIFERLLDGKLDDNATRALELYVERKRQDMGPWRQQIRVARSTDGLDFELLDIPPAVEHAAVAEAVVGPDGRTWLFFVDGDVDALLERARAGSRADLIRGIPSLGALGLAVSDDGLHFERVPGFEIQGLLRGMVVDPEVVPLPDGRWRMYYVGMALMEYFSMATWQKGEQHEVFYAESSDLIHWQQKGRALRGPYADPTVICHPGGRCLMLSFGIDHSVSEDGGVSFTYEGGWGPPGFAPDVCRVAPDRYRMYYNDMAAGAPLRSMVSADGEDWEAEPGERLPAIYAEAPSAITQPDGSVLLYFHTVADAADLPDTTQATPGTDGARSYNPHKRAE